MKMFYIHGFNSSPAGRTATELASRYGCTPISYDYIHPDAAHQTIDQALRATFPEDTDIILVGTSLGGFWANYFAQRFNISCLLINPSLTPSESLKKYLGINKNFDTGEERELTEADCAAYKKYEGPINRFTQRVTLLGTKDEVIDYQKTEALLQGTQVILNPEEGHRISNFNVLHPIIERIINTIAG